MKTILILFVIALAKCDKLDKLYLPPIEANYSGGSFEDTVPFQVPEERYTVNKVDTESKFISENDPNRNFGGMGSSIYTSTGVPPTTSKSVSIVPFSDKPMYDQATQGLSNKPVNSDAYNPTQYSDYYNSKNTGPLGSSVQNQFKDSILADRSTLSLLNLTGGKYEGRNPINAEKYVIPENINYVRYPEKVTRPQAEADRNAGILNYDNFITPEGFAYSYDTSNGIHADENGTAIDGVKADGSYSYIGDDGKLYNITYSADENGFRPRGDHLPTSPPIPDAILKVIEQAARDKSNGIFDDGSYDENKYGYQKYRTPQEKFLSINKPTPTRKYNSGTAKQSENSNINNARDGDLNSRDKNYFTKSTTNPIYTSDGNTITNPRRPIVDGQEDMYDGNKSQTANVIQELNKDFRQGTSEPKKAYDRQSYKNQESNGADLSNGQIPQNELGYKYPSPNDNFESSNFNNDKGFPNNDYNENMQNSDINPQSSNQNKIPLIEGERLIPQNYDVNKFIDPDRGYPYRNRDYQFGQRIPSETSTRVPYDYYSTLTTSRPVSVPQRVRTSDANSERNKHFPTNDNQNQEPISSSNYPSNDQTVKQFDTYSVRPNKFYLPSSTDRIKQFDAYTGQPKDFYSPPTTDRIKQIDTYTRRSNDFYGPASTERIKEIDTYTGRPNDLYSPSSTERLKQTGTYTGRPNGFYGLSSTERTNKIDTKTGRPNDYYGLSSTERIKQIDTYTGRPNDLYSPPSTEKIKKIDTYTGRPNEFYGPSSTERIKQIDTYTGRPDDYYGLSSTERTNKIDTKTGQPNEFYGPSSTERIKQIDTYTGRPDDYYGLSSTEGIKQTDTFTGRPNYSYGPSSTERINEIDTYYESKPSDYYGPSSTERLKQFDIYTDRPNYSLSPSSIAGIKQTVTDTDTPNDFYSPSSTEIIKQIGVNNGSQVNQIGTYGSKPFDYNGPSSTERVTQFGTYTDGPNENYGPSITSGINRISAYVNKPNDNYGPTSTEEIKKFDTYTDRPKNYYNPSSTERIKQIGTSDAPQIFKEDSSTADKIIGENFAGPKQPQSYDPETGYHY